MSMAFLGAMTEANEQALEQALLAMQMVSVESDNATTDEAKEEAEVAEVTA